MKLFNKFLPEIIAAPILVFFYFSTRLYSILSLPMFTDEAIYTRWAQIAKIDSAWRFISLTDGKQPSFVWAQMIVMRFVEDPLLAGRLVSVIAGALVVMGIYFLTKEIFAKNEKKREIRLVALTAAAIAVFYPFSLVYDRLAIYESLTAAFFVWALYFQIFLVKHLRLDIAMILGFILGGGVLTKSSAFLSVYMTPFLLLLFNFQKKGLRARLLRFALFSLVSIVIAYAIYQILRLSPYFHIIGQKNAVFVFSPDLWLTLPLSQKIEFLISNSRGLLDWFITYFTIPFIVLVILSFVINKKLFFEKLALILWFLLPFISLCIFGKTLYPRYLLFMTLPLIPLVALSLYELLARYKNLAVRVIIIAIVAFLPLRTNYYILTDFARAPIPYIDLEQFINGWPAGGGLSESVEFFQKESQKGEIMIGTQGTFGLMPAAYEIYLKDNPNIRINGFWPVENDKVPDLLLDYAQRIPTYFVFYQPCSQCDFPGDAPDGLSLRKIASYKKGIGNTALTIYQVIPQKNE